MLVGKCFVYHLKRKTNLLFYSRFYPYDEKSSDFSSYNIIEDGTLCLFYYKSTVESLIIKRFILAPIKNKLDEIQHIDDILNVVSIEDILINPSIDDIREKLLGGYVLLQLKRFRASSVCTSTRREYRFRNSFSK